MLCWGTCSELWQLEREMWRKTLILYLFCMQNALHKKSKWQLDVERNGHTSIGKKRKKKNGFSYWTPQNSLHNSHNKNELKTWPSSFQNKRKIINKYIKKNQTSLLSFLPKDYFLRFCLFFFLLLWERFNKVVISYFFKRLKMKTFIQFGIINLWIYSNLHYIYSLYAHF